MTKAQCYYEILGVAEAATGEEIKKAYKAQALVWHPDKNQSNPEEAHAKFQTILKAYETLSDSRERDWYDRHKDQILFDGDKNEVGKCINLFQYFSSACYANFDDSEDGFYTVYRNVFEEIAEEERQAIQQLAKFSKSKSKTSEATLENSFPTFGESSSTYDDVVKPFYAFWSGFCTQLTFNHLDKYNTTEAENRRILRLMEKENKKFKDAARKERNTNVRNLVEFIKKRDKRLKAHKLLVEQQNELNRQKTLEKQRQQRQKSSKQSADYKPSAWLDLNDVEEQLQQLENEYDDLDLKRGKKGKSVRYDKDSNDSDNSDELEADINNATCNDNAELVGSGTADAEVEDEEDEEEEEVEENYFCPACNKDFRSINAFENHELSKKHKQNVHKLTQLLKADEKKLNK